MAYPRLGLACMTLGIGLESSREIKGFGGIFFENISSWLAQQEGIRAVFGSRKIQSSSSPFFGATKSASLFFK